MTLRNSLDTLASAIAKKAAKDNTPLQESTDALKALTGYYAVTLKRAKAADDDSDTDTFDDFASGIHEGSEGRNGAAEVRNRRRSTRQAS